MWISTSWNRTLSNVKLLPDTRAPFSSITLPIAAFLNVTLSAPGAPWFSKAAVVAMLASTLIPSNVTFEAELSSSRTFTPDPPRKVTRFVPAGTACAGYVPAATLTVSPAVATA